MSSESFYLPSHDSAHVTKKIKQMWFFLDDEREPPTHSPHNWAIFRTGDDMLRMIDFMGCFPDGISFDHDLGNGVLSGHETVKVMLDWVLDNKVTIPDWFEFRTHSQNPIGEGHIIKTMEDLIKLARGNQH